MNKYDFLTESNYWPFGILFFTLAAFALVRNSMKVNSNVSFLLIFAFVMAHPFMAVLSVFTGLSRPRVSKKWKESYKKRTGMNDKEVLMFSNLQFFIASSWLGFLYLTHDFI